uniref:Uncharacterized protein n=1 Tax=Solanum lycopersicum TaxID=4081 RepID=A0A3Q7FR54_SOLLC
MPQYEIYNILRMPVSVPRILSDLTKVILTSVSLNNIFSKDACVCLWFSYPL